MTSPRVVKIFKGKKGVRGQNGINGINGLGSENIRAGLINNPLSSILESKNPAKLIDGPLNSIRTSEATYENSYGETITKGLSTNTNLFTYSESFSEWSLVNQSILSSSELDPLGGQSATKIEVLAPTNALQFNVDIDPSKFYTISFWIKSSFGAIDDLTIYTNRSALRQKTGALVNDEFKRFDFYVAPGDFATLLGVQVFADVGTQFVIFGVMLQEGCTVSDYIKTNGVVKTSVSVDEGLLPYSDSYIFEGEVTNLIRSSESLTFPWSLFSAAVSEYEEKDPFSNKFRDILVNCNGIGEGVFSMSQPVTVSDNQVYTLSFYAKKISGAITSLIASLGGGESISYETPGSAEFVRYEIQLTAGTLNNLLKIEMSSPAADAKVAFTGLMLELGNKKSSYVRTNKDTITKNANYISANSANNIMSPELNYSLIMNIYDYEIDQGEEFTIFDNGEAGVNNYSYLLTSESVNIRNAVEVLSIPYTEKINKLAITNDSGLISVYGNGDLLGSGNITSQIVSFSDSAFYFANGQGEKNYNGKASNIEWFTKPLNADEIKYIHGSDL